MSIKIYDGLIIERDMTLLAAKALASKIRPLADALIEAEQTRLAARAAARAYDQALMGRRDAQREGSSDGTLSSWRNALSVGGHAIDEERSKDKKGERAFVALGLEAALIPIGPGKTLALSYGSKELQEIFARASGAKEYGYWDNTDEPEGMGRREWGQRKRDWQKALGKTMQFSPAEAGVSLMLSSLKYKSWWMPEREQIAEAVAGMEDFTAAARARSIARNELLGALIQERKAEFENDSGLSSYMRVHRECDLQMRSEEGQARVEAFARQLEPLLPELTLERLEMPLEKAQEQGEGLRRALAESRALSEAIAPAETARKPRL